MENREVMQERQVVGKYLKKKRMDQNLSQGDVAHKLGLKVSQFISNFERGLCLPSWKILRQLTKIYKIPDREIMQVLLDAHKATIKRKLKI